jgi:hypothetical protein
LLGKLEECELYDLSKAKKKKTSKENKNKSTVPCGRIYLDISPIKSESTGNKKH